MANPETILEDTVLINNLDEMKKNSDPDKIVERRS
jgi:hypothetical protein